MRIDQLNAAGFERYIIGAWSNCSLSRQDHVVINRFRWPPALVYTAL